jgi:hypothetical protein
VPPLDQQQAAVAVGDDGADTSDPLAGHDVSIAVRAGVPDLSPHNVQRRCP